ncbi:MAG: DUF1684 domain-containing protein [Deltaproteobacteria bacterium]|nr:DUF1684 domain-containing protein [Deltaproteobacteria bacterium]
MHSSFFLSFHGLGFWLAGLLLIVVLGCGGQGHQDSPAAAGSEPSMPVPTAEEHLAAVEAWHAGRIERLRSESGWLTLVGLFWLEEGENTFGSGEENDLVFPPTAPKTGGSLFLVGGKVQLEAAPGVEITFEGEPVSQMEMASDATGNHSRVEMGSFNFYIIDRGGRLGVRLKDKLAPALQTFEGIDRFPVDPRWRIEARWEAYDPPKMIGIPDVLGEVSQVECLGAAVFEVDGQAIRLEPTGELSELFLVFGDKTNGKATYGAGRFLVLGEPAGGKVIVDFNQAYNPPCVFTPYATCPLPPKQNKLAVAIPAGEKDWGHH